jgi:hypothetical protein
MATMTIKRTVKRPERKDFRTVQEYHEAKLAFFEEIEGKKIISVTFEETLMG